jgi:hypothetical protein
MSQLTVISVRALRVFSGAVTHGDAALRRDAGSAIRSRMDEIADRVAYERTPMKPTPFVLSVRWPRSRPKSSAEVCGRAAASFILTRFAEAEAKACPTRCYPGF